MTFFRSCLEHYLKFIFTIRKIINTPFLFAFQMEVAFLLAAMIAYKPVTEFKWC